MNESPNKYDKNAKEELFEPILNDKEDSIDLMSSEEIADNDHLGYDNPSDPED